MGLLSGESGGLYSGNLHGGPVWTQELAGPCSTTANQNYRRVFVLNNYPGTLFPNGSPAFGYVDSFDERSNLQLQRPDPHRSRSALSKGLLMNANYTWSHCIGDLSIGDSTGNAGQGLTNPNNRRL